MVDFLRSAGAEAKTGLYSCKAGGACTAGNIVKIVAGGTFSPTSGNTIKTEKWCVQDIAAGDSGSLVFGIAKQTGTTTSGAGSTPADIEVIPLVNGDIIKIPYGTVASALTNPLVVGSIYGLSEATSGAFDTQTIALYEASPTTLTKCLKVLAIDTTNGYAMCQFVGETT